MRDGAFLCRYRWQPASWQPASTPATARASACSSAQSQRGFCAYLLAYSALRTALGVGYRVGYQRLGYQRKVVNEVVVGHQQQRGGARGLHFGQPLLLARAGGGPVSRACAMRSANCSRARARLGTSRACAMAEANASRARARCVRRTRFQKSTESPAARRCSLFLMFCCLRGCAPSGSRQALRPLAAPSKRPKTANQN